MFVFSIRPIWLELGVPMRVFRNCTHFYFGNTTREITDRNEAITMLQGIVSKIQSQMIQRFENHNVKEDIKALYKILDEVYRLYYSQKMARQKLSEQNVHDEQFEQSRNIAINIIDATNLWIENCLLYQDRLGEKYDAESFDLDYDLLVTMYIYGFSSRALSLLTLSQKFKNTKMYSGLGDNRLFYGLQLNPDNFYPAEILKYHPVSFFNASLTGNQNALSGLEEIRQADIRAFGKGFCATYGVGFIGGMQIMGAFEHYLLHDGKYAFTVIEKNAYLNAVSEYSLQTIDAQKYFDTFVLTRERINSQKRKKTDPIIWISATNQYRHELRPFLCLDDESVYISYAALEQAKNLWLSFELNGGMCYSNARDDLTVGIEKRNDELSICMVNRLRSSLQKHYVPSFDEINVRYDRIFGVKPTNYGDYDIVFFSSKTNELFLIEAKFMSDSLNNSGVITDYDKMFKKDGYYDHCRHRYDLVLQEPEKMRQFIGAAGEVEVHFLFVSSKPLEVEFQDEDHIVSFLCLSIFDKYLEGKLESVDGKKSVRPTIRI